jgi:hypothetical protein
LVNAQNGRPFSHLADSTACIPFDTVTAVGYTGIVMLRPQEHRWQ